VPWYFSWEDVISAVLLFGPPGRAVLCHNAKELAFREGEHQGVFQVTIGPMAVAVVGDLSAPPNDGDSIPVLSKFKVRVSPRPHRGFNDQISSLQLVSNS
jgi:hypothetical protein